MPPLAEPEAAGSRSKGINVVVNGKCLEPKNIHTQYE